jgi:uncharacterized membrane protein
MGRLSGSGAPPQLSSTATPTVAATMTPHLKPFTTTLIGGVVFLLPLIVVLYVLGQGLALTAHAVQPLMALLPVKSVGGITLASLAALALLLLLCFGAGLLARAAVGQAFSARFEDKLQTLYPRYSVIKAMSQGLHGALGKKVLKPVLASFDDNQLIGFDIERLDDGRVVLYVPGAPDAWSGNVLLVAPERVQSLDIDAGDLAKSLQGLGLGMAGLMRTEAAKAKPRITP